jgi:hypothetical protein
MNKHMYTDSWKSVGFHFITTKVHNFNLYLYVQNKNIEPLAPDPNFTPTEVTADIEYKLSNSNKLTN